MMMSKYIVGEHLIGLHLKYYIIQSWILIVVLHNSQIFCIPLPVEHYYFDVNDFYMNYTNCK